MTVVPFRPKTEIAGWRSSEVNVLLSACGEQLKSGAVASWEAGATEAGDPQLYLLGPAPDHDCILCISRIGRTYVVEDGLGRIVHENDALGVVSEQVRGALRNTRAAIVARVMVAWLAIRETFEERIEPVMGEPAEVLAHISPQLTALI